MYTRPGLTPTPLLTRGAWRNHHQFHQEMHLFHHHPADPGHWYSGVTPDGVAPQAVQVAPPALTRELPDVDGINPGIK